MKKLTFALCIIVLALAAIWLVVNICGAYRFYGILNEPPIMIKAEDKGQSLPKPLQGIHHIVCVGDSITKADYACKGYVALLQEYFNALYPQANIKVENLGVDGATSDDLIQHFESDVLKRHPDLITICVGVNDVCRHTKRQGNETDQEAIAKYEKNMSSMIDLAQNAKIPLLVLSPTPTGEDLESRQNKLLAQFIRILKSIALERGVQFVDLNEPFTEVIRAYQDAGDGSDNVVTMDGIHPNRLGHRLMVNKVLTALGILKGARHRMAADCLLLVGD